MTWPLTPSNQAANLLSILIHRSTAFFPHTQLALQSSLRDACQVTHKLSRRLWPKMSLLWWNILTFDFFFFFFASAGLGDFFHLIIFSIILLLSPFTDDHRLYRYESRRDLCAKSVQLCPTLWDPVDCSPSGSSVHGILQAKIPEWVVMPSSRGPSWPRGWIHISLCFLHWQATSLPLAPV